MPLCRDKEEEPPIREANKLTHIFIKPKLPPKRRNRLFNRLRFASVTVVTGIAVLSLSEVPHQTSLAISDTLVKSSPGTRIIYPYSVIPGGVQSPVELRQALLRDRVAANHYDGFDLDRTRIQHLTKPRQVYVSYRVADRIYWTRKRLQLPKGETILTDGVNSTRTRCGNRIADLPQGPHRDDEPTEQALNFAPPKPLETKPISADSHLLGGERIGRGVVPPVDYLAAFGATVNPRNGQVGGLGAPTGYSPVPGSGIFFLPKALGPTGKDTSSPITQTGGPLVPAISPISPITSVHSNDPSISPSLPVSTITPSNPLLLPALASPGSGILPVNPGPPGLLVKPLGSETLSPSSFFLPNASEVVFEVSNSETKANESQTIATTIVQPPANTNVDAPEPGTVIGTLVGTVLLLLLNLRLRSPEPKGSASASRLRA